MFELAWPWAFILLPLPVLIWRFLPQTPLNLSSALKVPFYQTIAGLVDSDKYRTGQYKSVTLFFCIWLLLLLALSGPRWVGTPQSITREGYNILLALDLSGSMEVTDMLLQGRPASRLSIVKQAAKQFINKRAGDKMGLILFGSRAYLQTPLTYDHQNLLMRVDDATVGLAGKTTSIGDALGLAIKHLQHVPDKGRVIILLTDGANNSGVLSPMNAAELAVSDNIKIYTIGLGSESDPRVLNNMFLNMNPMADLDEKTLTKVADITGGQYFRATDVQSLESIYQTINQLEKNTQQQPKIRPQYEYYPWPLSLALLLFMAWFMMETDVLSFLFITFRREVSE